MIEKIKKLGNLPLIIILVVVVIIAVILSIIKAQNTKDTNANTNTIVSNTPNQEEIKQEDEEQTPTITDINVQEIEDETETEPEENVDAKYFIRVNYGQNVVTIYTKDSNGEYTVPYKAMVCSTGTATPRSGTYTIPSGTYSRGTWGMMIGGVWAQYFTRIRGSILFHSVPYFTRDKSDLEYLEYDKLGTAASAGCIRLTVEDAKWIYNNCPAGTKVEFYTDSNPGPLVPQTPQKISEHEEVRGWDPTDPDSRNPWKTYEPDEDEEEPEDNNTTTKPVKKPTPTPTKKPTSTSTPTPTPEPEPDSKPEETPTPTPTPDSEPDTEPTPEPTPEATPTPDVTPEPTPEPTPEIDAGEEDGDEIIGEEENT